MLFSGKEKNRSFFKTTIIFLAGITSLIALFNLLKNSLKKSTPKKQLLRTSAEVSLPIRGQKNDLWADIVLGQRNFNEVNPYETVPDKLFFPGGVAVDRSVSPNILYVLDSGNNRVLGINLQDCLERKRNNPNSRCQPIKVIGQPDYISNSCNKDSGFQTYPQRPPSGRDTLCLIPERQLSIGESGNGAGLFIDSEGNLYLPDIHNNRVLKYNHISTEDSLADEVWGQADFSGNECNRGGNPSNQSFCFTTFFLSSSAKLDPAGNLWIADAGNHRVLRFPKQEDGTVSKSANLVLGQDNFELNWWGSSLDQFHNPSSLDFDSQGKLYVTDTENDRILVFSPPFTKGMSGTLFGSNCSGSRCPHFQKPLDIKIERISPNQDKVWVNDMHNTMIECWNTEGTEITKVIGKRDHLPSGLESRSSELFDAFGSFDFDSQKRLYAVNRAAKYSSNTLVFENNDSFAEEKSLYQLFSPPAGNNLITSRGFDSGRGIVVTNDQLIITDARRILFWNNPQNLFNGRPIDGLIGGNNAKNADGSPNFASDGPERHLLRKDNQGRLWSTTTGNGGNPTKLGIYQLPLQTGQAPLKEIRFGPNDCLKTLEGESICNPLKLYFFGLAPSPDGSFVWISHPRTNRVFRIRNPLSNDPRVDVILGQENNQGICCNRNQNQCVNGWESGGPITSTPYLNTLCQPGAVSLDNFGNLYVADHYLEIQGNFRILIYKKEDLPTNNTQTLYNISAFKEFENMAAFDMVFDSSNRMIVGQNGLYEYENPNSRFLAYFNDPLNNTTGIPDGYFKDLYSISFSAAFDQFNNLYVTEHNRNRVLVYKKPFASPPPSLSPTQTPIPSLCPKENEGNLDCDSQGLINEIDLTILLTKWSPTGPIPSPGPNQRNADLDKNGKVDEIDLTILLSHWKT